MAESTPKEDLVRRLNAALGWELRALTMYAHYAAYVKGIYRLHLKPFFEEEATDGSAMKTCIHCGANKSVESFRWHKEAGFGRFNFHISFIHPLEIVPADLIFLTLEQATDFSWAYFYANNRINNETD